MSEVKEELWNKLDKIVVSPREIFPQKGWKWLTHNLRGRNVKLHKSLGRCTTSYAEGEISKTGGLSRWQGEM